MRMVFVEWYDAKSETENDWTPVEESVGDLALCYSLGFLVKETDRSLVVAGHTDDKNKDFCGEINIPKSCVIRVREVLLTKD